MSSSDVIAIVALAVSAAALLLELRRWLESGPRMRVSVMSDVVIVDSRGVDRTPKYAVMVTNRGEVPTTITNMLIYVYPNFWARWRRKPSESYIVTQPDGGRIPHALGANEQWSGIGFYDEKLNERRKAGTLYMGVAASHSNKVFMAKVDPVKEAKEAPTGKE